MAFSLPLGPRAVAFLGRPVRRHAHCATARERRQRAAQGSARNPAGHDVTPPARSGLDGKVLRKLWIIERARPGRRAPGMTAVDKPWIP
jgi:hypothetical protein